MKRFDPRSPKSLFDRYLSDFPNIGMRWSYEDKKWTEKNFQYFSELGEGLNYDVYPQHTKRKEEYLVDLCWKSDEEHYWIELALEQEWGGPYEALRKDFYKLLDIKAYLKVFICSPYKSVISSLPDRLSKEVARHKIGYPHEAYLLIIIPENATLKKERRILVEGYAINHLGNITKLGEKYFPE